MFLYLIDEFEEISVLMYINCRDYEFKIGECFFLMMGLLISLKFSEIVY